MTIKFEAKIEDLTPLQNQKFEILMKAAQWIGEIDGRLRSQNIF